MIFSPLYKEVSSSWTKRTGDTVTGLCHHGKAWKRDKNHFQGCVQRQKWRACLPRPDLASATRVRNSNSIFTSLLVPDLLRVLCVEGGCMWVYMYMYVCVRMCAPCMHVEARQHQHKMSSSITFPPYFWRQSLLLNPKLADELRPASKPRDAPVSTFPVAGFTGTHHRGFDMAAWDWTRVSACLWQALYWLNHPPQTLSWSYLSLPPRIWATFLGAQCLSDMTEVSLMCRSLGIHEAWDHTGMEIRPSC